MSKERALLIAEPALNTWELKMSKSAAKSLASELDRFVAPFRVDGSTRFHLRSLKTAEKGGLDKYKG